MRRLRTRIGVSLAVALAAASGGAAGIADAQAAATLRVGPGEDAQFETIGAAVEAAADGDTILIAPGEYRENLFLDKAVNLVGDGAPEAVVLAPNRRAPRVVDIYGDGLDDSFLAVTVQVDGVDATLEHLTLDDEPGAASMLLWGGAPEVRDVVAGFVAVRGDATALLEGSHFRRVSLWGPNTTEVRDNTVDDMIWASEGASARIERNLVRDRPIQADSGANVEVVGNIIRPLPDELGINVLERDTRAIVRDNDIHGGRLGVHLEVAQEGLIEGNTLAGQEVGMLVKQSRTTVRGNQVSDIGETGIVLVGDGIQAESNIVAGGRIGLHVENPDDYPPELLLDEPTRILGNTLTGATHFGLVVEGPAIISGNVICSQREQLRIRGGDPELGPNDICAPA